MLIVPFKEQQDLIEWHVLCKIYRQKHNVLYGYVLTLIFTTSSVPRMHFIHTWPWGYDCCCLRPSAISMCAKHFFFLHSIVCFVFKGEEDLCGSEVTWTLNRNAVSFLSPSCLLCGQGLDSDEEHCSVFLCQGSLACASSRLTLYFSYFLHS